MSDSSSEPHRPRRGPAWAWILLIAVVLAGGYWLIQKDGDASDATKNPFAAMGTMAIPVRVDQVQAGRIDVTRTAIGTVVAFNTVTVRSRVDGELRDIYFTDGQKVQKGDLLAQIDPRTYQAQLDQALGQQKQNEAQLKNAQRDLERYRVLYKQNSIARQQVDAQEALVQQFLGTKKSNQAAVDSARLQLEFTRITAPITGRLGLRKVDPGNLISGSTTDGLVVITQTQPISVLFTLPQSQLPDVLAQMHSGARLQVDLYDRADAQRIARGKLMAIDNQIDVATGTVKLKARFSNEDEALFPNQFVNVHLRVSSDPAAIVVPTLAVQQRSVGAFVYRVDKDNHVHIQPVVTGTVDGAHIQIESGLAAGQVVVVQGFDRLREGARVDIAQTAPAQPPTSAPEAADPDPASAR